MLNDLVFRAVHFRQLLGAFRGNVTENVFTQSPCIAKKCLTCIGINEARGKFISDVQRHFALWKTFRAIAITVPTIVIN